MTRKCKNRKKNVFFFFKISSLVFAKKEKYGEKYFTEEGQGKAGGKFQGLTGHNLHLVTDHTETPLRHGGQPFERPPPSLRLPSSASVNPPSSGTRVAMDEMLSSNPRNVLELYQV